MSASHETARQLVGMMMLTPSITPMITLPEAAFPDAALHPVIRAIKAYSAAGRSFDAIVIAEAMERSKYEPPDGETWFRYVTGLVAETASSASFEAYQRAIRDGWVVSEAHRIMADALQSNDTQSVRDAIRGLSTLELTETTRQATIAQLIPKVVDHLDELQARKGNPGLPTGIKKIDSFLGGLVASDLYVIAGRPAMGKTSLMGSIALNNPHEAIGIISAEQPSEQIVSRMAAQVGLIDSHKMRLGSLSDEEWNRFSSAMATLSKHRLFFDDTSAPFIQHVAAVARKWTYEHGLKVLFIDYIQRMRAAGFNNNRQGEVEEIARGLKEIAKDNGIAVVAFSQVNRNVESRSDKRPMMSDLRDSGAIEQECDGLMTIYRPVVYDKDHPRPWEAEICVMKNRHGPAPATAIVDFDAKHLLWSDPKPRDGWSQPDELPE